jgi:hypothetical protein
MYHQRNRCVKSTSIFVIRRLWDILPTMPKDRETKAYVKFLGSAGNRVPWGTEASDVVRLTVCNRVVGFSPNRAPNAFQDGDVIYLSRLTTDPNDFVIFGKGIAIKYDDKVHRATAADIAHDPWRKYFPCLLHLRDTQFVDASLKDCISLYGVMNELEHLTCSSTERNFEWNLAHPSAKKQRNIDPRRSVNQQPGLYLGSAGRDYIEYELSRLFIRYGTIPRR